MADVQSYFEKFHREIRMDYELNKELAEKRDILVEKIKKSLTEKKRPKFDSFLQGSYVMKTGVKPIEKLEHDIDVGLSFYIGKDKHSATEVRSWVFEAVKNHTNDVDDKPSCIRVNYEKGYHVDLVTYAVQSTGITEIYHLAHKNNGWRPADPPGLLNHVESIIKKYKDTEDGLTKTNQFRRIVRYLRRWDDEAIPKESDAKPSGLGFILLVDKYLNGPKVTNKICDDLVALLDVSWRVSSLVSRIQINKPTPEYEDLFSKISSDDMDRLKRRFKALSNDLQAAQAETSRKKACKLLKAHFGRDFPVPDDEDEGEAKKGGFTPRKEQTVVKESRFA